MNEWFYFQDILSEIINSDTPKAIAKKYSLDVAAKIKDYENHLENIYRSEQDSEISL